jgi:hypothetical protein
MSGGTLFFILSYFFFRNYNFLRKLDVGSVLFLSFFLLANGGAIVGAILGFIDKNWQVNKNWQIDSVKVGRILCFLAGFSYPLFLSVIYIGAKSLTFAMFFKDFIDFFYINIPELLLFIGGITGMIEWRLELKLR